MELENAIKHAEKMEESELNNAQVYDKLKNNNMYLPNKDTCELVAKRCRERATEYRQLAEWLKILKSAKFEYDEAWRIITHPTADVNYADKQRAQVILDKFRNSLGAISALQTHDVNDTNVGDMISRQAAIDVTWEEPTYTDPLNVLTEVRDKISALPSAQPDIIRCKDCKWWSNDDYRECSNPNYDDGYVTPAGFYCGYAERKGDE